MRPFDTMTYKCCIDVCNFLDENVKDLIIFHYYYVQIISYLSNPSVRKKSIAQEYPYGTFGLRDIG